MSSPEQRKRESDARRQQYIERRVKNLCTKCGGIPILGKTLCIPCSEKSRANRRNFYKIHREQILKQDSKRMRIKHLEALKKIAEFHKKPIQCFNCLCSDVTELEIEHSNNDGWAEKKKGWSIFITGILNGSRKLDDLRILCHVCNVCSFENFTTKSGRWEVIFYPSSHKAC